MNIDDYPHLKRAALIIAFDNAMIIRFCGQEEFLKKCEEVIGAEGVSSVDVQALDTWLSTLSDGQLMVVCAGGHKEMTEICRTSPKTAEGHYVTGLLDDIFEL